MPGRSHFIFIIPLFIFTASAIFIEYSLRTAFSLDSYFTKAIVNARLGAVSCAIFGDSHGAASFRDELTNCHNFSAGGMSLQQISDSLESVSQTNQLNRIVLTFGPQLFSAGRVHNRSRIFRDIAKEFTPFPNPLVVQPLMFDRWRVWLFQQLHHSTEVNARDWGDLNPAAQQRAVNVRLQLQQPMAGYSSSDTFTQLTRLVEQAVEQGIQVCLVRTPVTVEYEQALSPILDSAIWVDMVEQLRRSGAKVLDFRSLGLTFDATKFKNEDHLNEAGAIVFAQTAADYCF